jgi:UDP-N-acetylmuramoyl-tripeptide--D-alanyl-D-alanine ligase
VHNALAAAAVAASAGLSTDEIAAGLRRPADAPHRSQLVRVGGWLILDDSYNASPDAMTAALELLATLPGRHVAVLGEMLELGPTAATAHREVGARCHGVVDLLVTVGEGARGIAEGAGAAGIARGRIHHVPDRGAALSTLVKSLRDGDTILVKASRGAQLDLLVEALARAAAAEPTRT